MEAHSVVRRRDSHILKTIGSQVAVKLSVLRAGRPLSRGRSRSRSWLRHYATIRKVAGFMLDEVTGFFS
jgi:hypothetical protein